jgi:dihydrofolate reductase
MITLIAARARGNVIGKDGDMPWHLPEDLKYFMRETLGGAIIMGRNTWDSLPFAPLKNRLNIVVTSKGCAAEHCVASIDDAITLATSLGYHRIYGVGGAGIYSAMLPMADRLCLTEVNLEVEDADTFFPSFDGNEWRCVTQTEIRMEEPRCIAGEWLRG